VYPAHDAALRNFRGEVVEMDLGSTALSWDQAAALGRTWPRPWGFWVTVCPRNSAPSSARTSNAARWSPSAQ
jgi:hypothetical protein